MKKILLTMSSSMLVAVCVLFFIAAPSSAAEPAPDENISEVSLNINDTEPATTTNYTVTFTLDNPIVTGSEITFLFADEDGVTNDVDFSTSEFSSATLTGFVDYSYIEDTYEMFMLTATADIAAGEYGFSLSDVTNPTEPCGLAIGVTTEEFSEICNATISDVVSIGELPAGDEEEGDKEEGDKEEIPHTDDPVVEAVSVEVADSGAGASTTYTVSVDMVNSQPSENYIYMYIAQEDNGDYTELDYDFSEAEYSSTTMKGTFDGSAKVLAKLTYTEGVDEGKHIFTLTNVINPSEEGEYYFAVTTGTDVNKYTPFTYSENFEIEPAVVTPTKVKKKYLRVAKKKQRSVNLKITNAKDNATYYKFQLERRKKNWKDYKKKVNRFVKIKLYKNVSPTENDTVIKVLKKTKKIVKPGRTYRFKVKACNEAGCSAWSVYKNFTMKGEWL